MRVIQLAFATATIALAFPAQAQTQQPAAGADPKAVGDRLIPIYRVIGARDSGGGPGVGVATAIDCSSFSPVNETVRFVARYWNGTIRANKAMVVKPGETRGVVTHQTAGFTATLILEAGLLNQGRIEISATSNNIACNAMVLDAANPKPVGVALHAIRYNPIANTQE
jgi:hypothetical protein